MGSTVLQPGGLDEEVVKRIQAGWTAWRGITGVMCDRLVPGKVKGRMFKMMVRPAILCGMDAIAVTKAQEKKMEVAEMRMLRFSIGKTRMGRVRNEVIRTTLKVGELSGEVEGDQAQMVWTCATEG